MKQNSTTLLYQIEFNQFAIAQSRFNGATYLPVTIQQIFPSRGEKIQEFLKNDRWKIGSEFLWKSETHWSSQPALRGDDTFDTEVKKCAVLPLSTVSRKSNFFDSQCSTYSSWKKLLCVSAIILRYKNCFQAFLHHDLTRSMNKPALN